VTGTAPATVRQRVGRWAIARLPITRFLFDQLRLEANACGTRAGYLILPWRRDRLRAVRSTRDALVNVACGPHVRPDFLNLDLHPCDAAVFAWDCRRSLPLADRAAAGVRAEHYVEHLDPREELPAFLADVRRVLRPGAVLRVIVPDAERYLRAYCQGDDRALRELGVPDPFPDDLPTRMDVVNHAFHQWHEHRWGYDFDALAHRLRAAGFTRVERMAFQLSLDPRLACDRAVHAPYSLYVDAVTP
jgi:predicted SAM-dependent methyltransferase